MGTYITCKAKNLGQIELINKLWDKMNPGYENTFHLTTQPEMEEWLKNIHTDPKLKHLQYIKTTKQLDKIFPFWGLGCFQVKITLGDYLCADMASRYLRFFDKYGKYFKKNPIDDYVREILEQTIQDGEKAESCLVECPSCTG